MFGRTQLVAGQLSRRVACTIASALTAIAWSTRGRVGPDVSLDEFRDMQRDDEGGIDLYDAKFAARRLGQDFTVYADYAPGPEYNQQQRNVLTDYPAAKSSSVPEFLKAHRAVIIQFIRSKLPARWIGESGQGFMGSHAGTLLGYRVNGDGKEEVLFHDPLEKRGELWRAWDPIRLAIEDFAGRGKADIAVTKMREPRYTYHQRALTSYHRYFEPLVTGRRERLFTTTGFTVPVTPPKVMRVDGQDRRYVQALDGKFKGWWFNIGTEDKPKFGARLTVED